MVARKSSISRRKWSILLQRYRWNRTKKVFESSFGAGKLLITFTAISARVFIMSNFDRLFSIERELAERGNKAEKYCINDPEQSLLALRGWFEFLLKFLESKHSIPPLANSGEGEAKERINRLNRFGAALTQSQLNALHYIRMASNKAAHPAKNLAFFTAANAERALTRARLIADLLHETYGGSVGSVGLPQPTAPVQRDATTSSAAPSPEESPWHADDFQVSRAQPRVARDDVAPRLDPTPVFQATTNYPTGISTGAIAAGVVAMLVISIFAVRLYGTSVPVTSPSASPYNPGSAPARAPAERISPCAQEAVFDQAARDGAATLRNYILQCQPLGGLFVQRARNSLETLVYNNSIACIRSSCNFADCLASYARDFPSAGRIENLRAEAQAAGSSSRCRPASETFTFTACNRTPFPIQVAVMARQSPQSNTWIVQGWALGPANNCGVIGTYPKGEFYAVGIGPNGTKWANPDIALCVPQRRFQRANSSNYRCQPDEGLVSFQRFNIADDNFAWTLTSPAAGPPMVRSAPIGRPVDIGRPAIIGVPTR
jgi:uncharacterized membrane protein